jgi:glycosyltransferase involved in cell wall biosynthesis
VSHLDTVQADSSQSSQETLFREYNLSGEVLERRDLPHMLNIIVFSKDRACQLELLLRSLKIFFKNWYKYNPCILYTYSEPAYRDGYEKLKQLHPEFIYICEKDSIPFKQHVLNLARDINPYTVFLVDDIVFRQPFDLESEAFKVFTKNREILCLSLRLCPRINYCYSANKPAPPPTFEQHLIWDWQKMPPDNDWGYPMSLDGHVFRTEEIKPIIQAIEFDSPNFFEERLTASPINLPKMICYSDGKILNIPANRVQETHVNRHGNLITPAELNREFLDGKTISLKNVLDVKNTAAHQEIPLRLKVSPNDISTPKVSVIISCYNQAHALPQAIESLLVQTLQDFEIIIVNDGSTDDTQDVAERLIAVYPDYRIQLINQDQSGIVAARESSRVAARGKYKLSVDAEQVIASTMLAEYLSLMEEVQSKGTEALMMQFFYQWQQTQAELERSHSQSQSQLRQTQGSLERSHSENQKLSNWIDQLQTGKDWLENQWKHTQGELQQTQSHLQQTQGELQQTQSHLQQTQGELQQTQSHLQQTQGELQQTQSHLQQTQGELQQTQSHLQQTQGELQQTQATVEAIQSSKFWKLRMQWFKVRRLIGIVDDAESISLKKLFKPFNPKVKTIRQKKGSKNKPLVSVIIPCFNYGQYLEEAIDSVLYQTFQDFEIIVVDDGSDDPHTIEILSNLKKPKTRILRQANQKLPAARNNGIKLAKGKYICCLDADDMLAPTYLEKCLGKMEKENLDICYTWIQEFGDSNNIWQTGDFDIETLIHQNCVEVSAVFKRSIWKKTGGYDEKMIQGYEDWNFWIAIAKAGGIGAKVDEPLFLYRKHGSSMIDAAGEIHETLYEQIKANHRKLYVNDKAISKIKQRQGKYQNILT